MNDTQLTGLDEIEQFLTGTDKFVGLSFYNPFSLYYLSTALKTIAASQI